MLAERVLGVTTSHDQGGIRCRPHQFVGESRPVTFIAVEAPFIGGFVEDDMRVDVSHGIIESLLRHLAEVGCDSPSSLGKADLHASAKLGLFRRTDIQTAMIE